jgi:hypothetical protein
MQPVSAILLMAKGKNKDQEPKDGYNIPAGNSTVQFCWYFTNQGKLHALLGTNKVIYNPLTEERRANIVNAILCPTDHPIFISIHFPLFSTYANQTCTLSLREPDWNSHSSRQKAQDLCIRARDLWGVQHAIMRKGWNNIINYPLLHKK